MTATDENTSTSALSREVSLALKNMVKLTASMSVTFGIAFVVRFWIPRFLGPEAFGVLHFSEQFAMTWFFFIAFGTDVYIRKEVSTRPEHAGDFFGGLILLRIAFAIVLGIAMAFFLYRMNKDSLTWHLVYVFSLGQLFLILNSSLGALLESRGTIGELSTVNALVKVVWGAGSVGGLLLGMGPMAIAAAFLAAEILRMPVLYAASRKYLGLQLHFSMLAVKTIIIASLPYAINSIALGVYTKIGVTMLSFFTNDREVGWFGAATNITFIVFLFTPVLGVVMMPMSARLAKESTEILNKTILTAARIILMFTVPMAVLIALNAKAVIGILYTDSYLSAAGSLMISAPLIPLTYLCTISSVYLIQVNNIWKVTQISVVASAVSICLNAVLIGPVFQYWGDGGGGVATSIATTLTELLVASLLFIRIRHFIPSGLGEIGRLIVRLLIACSIPIATHPFVSFLGYWCILIESAEYVIVGMLIAVFPISEFSSIVKIYFNRRRNR